MLMKLGRKQNKRQNGIFDYNPSPVITTCISNANCKGSGYRAMCIPLLVFPELSKHWIYVLKGCVSLISHLNKIEIKTLVQ